MSTKPAVTGAVAVARIPGDVEIYLITRTELWDGDVLPVVLGHARTREAALAFARREAVDGAVWIDDAPVTDSYVLLPLAVGKIAGVADADPDGSMQV